MTRILIVDDEEDIRRSLEGILGDEGFIIDAVADGEAAIEAIEDRGPPDLVLLDIAMPGRDGVEILAELSVRWPELPVVMMSGQGLELQPRPGPGIREAMLGDQPLQVLGVLRVAGRWRQPTSAPDIDAFFLYRIPMAAAANR